MGIIQNWESIYGASFKDAYHRILEAHFDYIGILAVFKIGIYCTKDDRDNNRPPLFVKKLTVKMVDDEFPIRDAIYEYLKTLNDYSEAVDI